MEHVNVGLAVAIIITGLLVFAATLIVSGRSVGIAIL